MKWENLPDMFIDIVIYSRINNVQEILAEKLPNSLLFRHEKTYWHIYTKDIIMDLSLANQNIFLLMCKREVSQLILDDDFIAKKIIDCGLYDMFNKTSLKYKFKNSGLHNKITMYKACE